MTSIPVASRLLTDVPERGARNVDVVVVGTGAGGMSAALRAADSGLRVLVVTKGELGEGATAWAQGGLAAALAPTDSLAAHVEDTLSAGAGLCDRGVVEAVVSAAPRTIASLVALGARFDTSAGVVELGREGGHRVSRIVHAGGDASGAEVVRVLALAVRRAVDAGRIELAERTSALDAHLDTSGHVDGVTALTPTGVTTIGCRALVLATGGLGHAFTATTNPAGATGDGVALALRAGAVVTDLEFVQFHPTMLVPPGGHRLGDRGVLVSEAVRGEGAMLVDLDGAAVMSGVHPLGDLAPRDVVSATMHGRMRATGADHLLLDGTALGQRTWQRRFPTILRLCRERGVDPAREPVPVSPAAHYSCGGVRADLQGRTSVPGLYAVGEVAATGLHGANRLASNSIPEALVTGDLAGRRLVHDLRGGPELRSAHRPADAPAAPPYRTSTARLIDPATRPDTAAAMSAGAGVLRSPGELSDLLRHLDVAATSGGAKLSPASAEATNLLTVSVLIATAATARTESRGCHRRSDVAGPLTSQARRIDLALQVDGSVAVLPTATRAAA